MTSKHHYTKEEALHKVQKDGLRLAELDGEWKQDRDIVLAAVQQNGFAIEFSEVRRSHEQVKEIMLAAVAQNGYALEEIPTAWCDEKEVVQVAVTSKGNALLLAHARWQQDKEIVLAAVRQNGNALEFASPTLQNDSEVVQAAITSSHGAALYFAHEDIQRNKRIVLKAIRAGRDVRLLECAHESILWGDEEIIQLLKCPVGAALIHKWVRIIACCEHIFLLPFLSLAYRWLWQLQPSYISFITVLLLTVILSGS